VVRADNSRTRSIVGPAPATRATAGVGSGGDTRASTARRPIMAADAASKDTVKNTIHFTARLTAALLPGRAAHGVLAVEAAEERQHDVQHDQHDHDQTHGPSLG